MGSETPQISLPVVDFSKANLKPGNMEWELVRSQVREALEEFGCFKALFNVPVELRGAVLSVLKELFEGQKPSDLTRKPFGYIRNLPGSPHYESIGIDNPFDLEYLDKLASDIWPQGNPSFSKTMEGFGKQIVQLEKMVRQMVAESFGLEKYVDELQNSAKYDLRAMKYDVESQSNSTEELALEGHQDSNMITILHQNQVDGLEVQTKGGEWIRANMSTSDSFIVLLGQSFHAWTNGRLPSPIHRVIIKGKEIRYSIGLFSRFQDGYIVKSPEELVDKEYPLLFKPFEYSAYLKFIANNFAKGSSSSRLSTYCGV